MIAGEALFRSLCLKFYSLPLILNRRRGREASPADSGPMQQLDSLRAKRVLVTQAVLTLLLSAAGLFLGRQIALAVLIGAGAGTLANGFFAFWVFRRYRAQEPELLLMRLYGAEMAKIALILAAFSLAFLSIDSLNIPVLLTAFVIIQVIAPMLGARSGVG